MRKNRGFTLIELLVVIAIIAVLLTILAPALQEAKEQAKSTLCLSRQKQMSMAMVYYVEDNAGRTMAMSHTYGEYWFQEIAPYLGDSSYKKNAGNSQEGSDVEGVMKIAFCPATRRPKISTNPGETWWGSAKDSWRWLGGEGSYGMNLWLINKGLFYNSSPLNQYQDNYWGKYFLAKSDTPLFGDSTWVGSWPFEVDRMPPNLSVGDGAHNVGFFMGRFCIDRHGEYINVGFVDGRAERVVLEKLWSLKWHVNYIPCRPPE